MAEIQALKDERARASFDTHAMTLQLYGGAEGWARLCHLRSLVESDPRFSNEDTPFLNHTDLYNRGLEKAAAFLELLRNEGLTDPQEIGWAKQCLGFVLPIDVHLTMFVPTIMNQTTDDQRARWLPGIMEGRILGAYCQTELGHGSNVRGLETTATYDRTTQEWVVHSPTLTSTKWWPGGLGKTANHCVCHCRLIIDDKDYGVHPFFMPLRDMETHLPLPGRILGDIGPKLGFQSIDNGYARFDSVRIPRTNLLARYQSVSPEGEYVKKAAGQLNYGTMILIRSNLVKGSAGALSRATTICARFSAARLQGNAGPNGETAVLDYQEQQAQLFPLIAAAYACHFTGQRMLDLYQRTMANLQSGDTALLPETHATSSGLKALTSYMVSDGIESCRRLCGGHGYSHLSGLPRAFGGYVAVATLEGTREVMSLQTGRYLIKQAMAAQAGKPTTVDYIANARQLAGKKCAAHVADDFMDPALLLEAFAARAARVLSALVARIAALNTDLPTAMQRCQVDIVRASEAHCEYILVRDFCEALRSDVRDASLRAALLPLLSLFAMWLMKKSMGEFRDDDYLSSAQARLVHEHFLALLAVIRPNAVALNDAFDHSDQYLQSAIGCHDGDMYRRLYEWAQREPLNATPIAEGHEKFIKPMQQRARL